MLRPALTRRRFPYRGLVFVVAGLLGSLLCAGMAMLLRTQHVAEALLQRLDDRPLPPMPTFNNVLFGAGLPELMLACGLAGWWLWSTLWKTRLPHREPPRTVLENARALVLSALVLGPLSVFGTACIGIIGLYLRTAPANQPWAVRPFFALLAVPALGSSALATGLIPLALTLIGLCFGAVTAVGVAYFWNEFPEEPALR